MDGKGGGEELGGAEGNCNQGILYKKILLKYGIWVT